jgi:hypothetical protein
MNAFNKTLIAALAEGQDLLKVYDIGNKYEMLIEINDYEFLLEKRRIEEFAVQLVNALRK